MLQNVAAKREAHQSPLTAHYHLWGRAAGLLSTGSGDGDVMLKLNRSILNPQKHTHYTPHPTLRLIHTLFLVACLIALRRKVRHNAATFVGAGYKKSAAKNYTKW